MPNTYELKDFTPRVYQQTIVASALHHNTMVVLPTGLGKTAIALLMALHALKTTQKKVLMVAPTKPLVQQHLRAFLDKSTIAEDESIVFTGEIAAKKRHELFIEKRLIFSTPQTLENDIVNGKVDLTQVGLLVIDEAHRATGNYSYVWLVRQLTAKNPGARILGLTASPGADMETVEEVIRNLRIENLEYKTYEDPDVKPYVQETETVQHYVSLPDGYADIINALNKCFSSIIVELKQTGALARTPTQRVNKRDLLMLQGSLRGEMSKGNFDRDVIRAISLSAMAIKVQHAQELIESQGLAPLQAYFEEIDKQVRQKASKAVVELINNPQWRLAVTKARTNTTKHPKLLYMKDLVAKVIKQNKTGDGKVIVFSQYRDTLQTIVDELNSDATLSAELFLGQAKKNGKGMSQKQQQETIARFAAGEFNVACMSSVGEEGLDIPAVDAVVFYEPIPSAIRSIQRRGRTGRHSKGYVHLLIAKGTRDEAYRWVAHHKEKNMYKTLEKVKKKLDAELKNDTVTLDQFTTAAPRIITNNNKASLEVATKTAPVPEVKKPLKIYVDSREQHNIAVKLMVEQGVDITLQKMDVGDIIVSGRCGIEYKKAPDFVDSLLDGRLLEQIKELKKQFERPLVLVEGENLYNIRNVHPNAIMGMLSTITISYGIPILTTANAEQTAMLLQVIAKREQEGSAGASFTPHASKKPKSKNEMLEYLVSALPSVGVSTGKKLLAHFSTIKQLVDADVEQLSAVEGVGKKTASDLYMFFRTVYKKR